ncbi:hypothetical protein [Hymenobacter properus]|uniref:Uncharacterized protein n=1 Tax=Hymenobacter properus TaxID=2791026 RepID=A0A931BJZ0_9BACT|nr:hypothetical protein [Hymenobacter properus]MBF9142871.1 hypothetical protein [Hymenobacter properus]MBR7721678.1 hypothetical protein [Microvirga sp. SRT04]
MKTAAHHPQFHLAEDIQANLSELRRKYARQLQKPLAHTVHKLNHRLAKLLDEHTLAHHRKDARKIARYLVASLGNSFSQGPGAQGSHTAKRKKRPSA